MCLRHQKYVIYFLRTKNTIISINVVSLEFISYFCRQQQQIIKKMKLDDLIRLNDEIPLTRRLLLNIAFSQNLISDKLLDVLKPYDISLEQFNVLRILRAQEGKPINMGTIQDHMIAKTSNTTRLIDKLLLKKMVTRDVCKNNRRKIEVCITPYGLEVINKLEPHYVEMEKNITDCLSLKEQKELSSLLLKFIKQ